MSAERCKGCGLLVHDVDEHIEVSVACREQYPEETESLRELGIIS